MRIYVKISDKMGEKLEKYANDFGMSKSGFVAYALGSHINQLDYQKDVYYGVKDKMSNLLDKMSDKDKLNDNLERSEDVHELPPYPEDEFSDSF